MLVGGADVSAGLIAGVVVAVVVLILLAALSIFVILIYFSRRKKKTGKLNFINYSAYLVIHMCLLGIYNYLASYFDTHIKFLQVV